MRQAFVVRMKADSRRLTELLELLGERFSRIVREPS
jgi:hypothetical protein